MHIAAGGSNLSHCGLFSGEVMPQSVEGSGGGAWGVENESLWEVIGRDPEEGRSWVRACVSICVNVCMCV